MSQQGKTHTRIKGIEQFKTKIEDLKLSQENELRVKSLFQNYSEKIMFPGALVQNDKEEFKQFRFFPGIVLVFDNGLNVVYQNKPLNGMQVMSIDTFGGCFDNDTVVTMHHQLNKLTENKLTESLHVKDIEGNCYECSVMNFDLVRKLRLLFLYPDKSSTRIERTNRSIYRESLRILERGGAPLKFYILEGGGFVCLHQCSIFKDSVNQQLDNHYIEPIPVLNQALQVKMQEALFSGKVRIEKSATIGGSGRLLIIPLTENCVCLFTESAESRNLGFSAEDIIEKYKIIANSLTDLFFILDEDLKFTFIAPSIQTALDYSYQELLGEGFDTLVPKWSGNTLKKNLSAVLLSDKEKGNTQKFTIQLSGKYGNLKWYEVQVTRIYCENNELQGYNGICRDITERLKYEEALMQSKKKAEESDKLKSAFLANMSHEIRTPLNGIIGFSTMLNNRNLPEEKRGKYADYIIASSKQLLTLINDIIDVSKIEAEQLSVHKTKVRLHALLTELFATIDIERKRLNKEEVDLKLNLPDNNEIEVFTDEVRLRQVLINLLSNALKFTFEGAIEYGYSPVKENTLRFFVKDTGVGIPRNVQRAVFERFSQGEVDNQAKISGTGLGLAISKGIIELLGGKIGLYSNKGEGSEFYFTLPV